MKKINEGKIICRIHNDEEFEVRLKAWVALALALLAEGKQTEKIKGSSENKLKRPEK